MPEKVKPSEACQQHGCQSFKQVLLLDPHIKLFNLIKDFWLEGDFDTVQEAEDEVAKQIQQMLQAGDRNDRAHTFRSIIEDLQSMRDQIERAQKDLTALKERLKHAVAQGDYGSTDVPVPLDAINDANAALIRAESLFKMIQYLV